MRGASNCGPSVNPQPTTPLAGPHWHALSTKQTLTFGLGSESTESVKPEAQVALGPVPTIYPALLECQAAPSALLLPHPAIGDLGWPGRAAFKAWNLAFSAV